MIQVWTHCWHAVQSAISLLSKRCAPWAMAWGIAAILLLSPSAASVAYAQIVNVTSVLAVEAKPGLSSSLSGHLDWATGDDDTFDIDVAPVFRYRTGNHVGILYGKGEYDCNDSCDFLDFDDGDQDSIDGFAHARYRYLLTPLLVPEGFVQIQYDSDEDLQLRALVGGGPFFQLYARDRLRVGVGVAFMFEYERYSNGVTAQQPRISSYFTSSYQISENILVVETIYAQPLISSPKDFRLLNDISFAVGIIAQISVNLTLRIAYDQCPYSNRGQDACLAAANPDQDLERLDSDLTAVITYEFD